jgi:hypothetical protein
LNPRDSLSTADDVFESSWHEGTSRGNVYILEDGAVHKVDILADIDDDDLGSGRGLAESQMKALPEEIHIVLGHRRCGRR